MVDQRLVGRTDSGFQVIQSNAHNRQPSLTGGDEAAGVDTSGVVDTSGIVAGMDAASF